MSMEFVIEGNRRAVVEEKLSRIKQLFDVQISIANGTGEKVWITLKEGQVEKAKVWRVFKSNSLKLGRNIRRCIYNNTPAFYIVVDIKQHVV